jgi:uncharacterized protein
MITNTLHGALKRDFTLVKESEVHGKGLFAKKTIPKGTRIIEYSGLRVPHEGLAYDLEQGNTTLMYVMYLNKTTAIDGEREGNDARFINHSCTPNCEIMHFDEIPYIYAMFEIEEGTELSFDYKLGTTDGTNLTFSEMKEYYPCYCGTKDCRQTMIKI